MSEMSNRFIDELRQMLGNASVLTGADIDVRYYKDLAGRAAAKPRAVVRPRTAEQVSGLLRLCHREKIPVATQGGMTGLVCGALPNTNEIVLSMERMNAVEEVDISAGVAIVQAGAPLQTLQERVEQEGYIFPLDLGSRGSCTIGGNISTNAGGNRVIRYHGARPDTWYRSRYRGWHSPPWLAQIPQEQHWD
ncbi:FAD-binding oxidoreductase [Bradyrhizobium sp. CW7]|nr:FAD-binding oxidoreductase [Bradyrhizobium sp. CW7]